MTAPATHSEPQNHTIAGSLQERVWRYNGGVRPAWFGPTAAAGAALAVCAAVALRDPREEGSFGTCPWLFLTGTQCPGCGTLRSLNRLVGGDVIGALGYNVLTVLAVPLLAYTWLRWALPAKFSSHLPWLANKTTKLRAVYVLAVVLYGFGVLRNLPWEPFTWLLPTG